MSRARALGTDQREAVTRLLIVDDHPAIIAGVREFLAAGPTLTIECASDGEAALRLLRQGKAGLVLLDLWLPDMSGVEISRWIQENTPGISVLWMSQSFHPDYITLARELGVRGFISKSSKPQAFLEAIRTVIGGGEVWVGIDNRGPEVLVVPERNTKITLTAREQQVLEGVAAGLANKEIAVKLQISRRTVEWYRGQIYRRLGVKSAAELTKYSLMHGLTRL